MSSFTVSINHTTVNKQWTGEKLVVCHGYGNFPGMPSWAKEYVVIGQKGDYVFATDKPATQCAFMSMAIEGAPLTEVIETATYNSPM